jgi:hypothetical protein
MSLSKTLNPFFAMMAPFDISSVMPTQPGCQADLPRAMQSSIRKRCRVFALTR